MLFLVIGKIISLLVITLGMNFYITNNSKSLKKEAGKVLVGSAVALYFMAVVNFLKTELNFDIGTGLSVVFVIIVSLTSSFFIVKSCEQRLKIYPLPDIQVQKKTNR